MSAAPPIDPIDVNALFSPFSQLFGTNYSAQGPERVAVLEALSAAKGELSRLDALASWIESRKKLINEHSEKCEALISPMRRLPDEILREMMIQCAASNWEQEDLSPAWTLSQVCHRWRDIALSTPQAWSYISVQLDACKSEEESNTMHRIVDRIIDLSKTSTLAVEIVADETILRSYIWDTVLAESERMTFLRVVGNLESDDHFIFGNAQFPILNSLELCKVATVGTVFKASPLLTRVRLSYVDDSWEEYNNLQLPWGRLTSVAIQHTHGEFPQVLATLREISAVEELIISLGKNVVVPTEISTEPVDDVIILPALRQLSLRVRNPKCGRLFVQSLLLPSLKELTIDAQLFAAESIGPYDDHGRFYERLASLIDSSRCTITKFSLIDDDWAIHFIQLFKYMPDLECFTYYSSPHPSADRTKESRGKVDGILQLFAFDPKPYQTKTPFPRLKEISVAGGPLEEKKKTVLNLLRLRAATLRKFRLHIPNSTLVINPSDITELMKLGSHGLDVDIQSGLEEKFEEIRKIRAWKQEIDHISGQEVFNWTRVNGDR